MYVDEVGNNDLRSSADPNHRYLSLTGVILSIDHVRDVLHPRLESLKQEFFDSHPDEPVVLHRKELVNAKFPFSILTNQDVKLAFDQQLLELLRGIDYTVISTVLDKQEVIQRYGLWRDDPYRYCLEVIAEQYVLWLEARNELGDIMAESRGGREDRRLKQSFSQVCLEGTQFVDPQKFAARLSSHELKIKPKAVNVAGLQIADLIAHPSFVSTRCRQRGQELPSNFGAKVALILGDEKYVRSRTGKIDGWGRRWLP